MYGARGMEPAVVSAGRNPRGANEKKIRDNYCCNNTITSHPRFRRCTARSSLRCSRAFRFVPAFSRVSANLRVLAEKSSPTTVRGSGRVQRAAVTTL